MTYFGKPSPASRLATQKYMTLKFFKNFFLVCLFSTKIWIVCLFQFQKNCWFSCFCGKKTNYVKKFCIVENFKKILKFWWYKRLKRTKTLEKRIHSIWVPQNFFFLILSILGKNVQKSVKIVQNCSFMNCVKKDGLRDSMVQKTRC